MCLRLAALPALAALAAPLPVAAQRADLAALDAQLAGTLVNDPATLDWPLSGAADRRTIRSADIPGGGAAIRVTVKRAAAQPYDIQIKVPITGAMARGEDVTIGLYLRAAAAATDDAQGRIKLRFQQDSAPYPGFADADLTVGSAWKMYEVTGKADRDYPAGTAAVSIQLGAAAQTIELGQAIVVTGATAIAAAASPSGGTMPPPTAPEPAAIVPPRQLQGVGTVINDPSNRDWAVYGPGARGEAIPAAITGRAATRLTIAGPLPNRWDAGVAIPVGAAIAAGQPLRVAFLARTVASTAADGRGTVTVRLQSNRPPYDGFGDGNVAIGTQWQLIQLRTTADRALPAGEGVVALHLAGAAQTLEVGPLWVIAENR